MVNILAIVLILGGSSVLVYALTMSQDQSDRVARPARPPRPPRTGRARIVRGRVSFEDSFDLTASMWTRSEVPALPFASDPEPGPSNRLRSALGLVLLVALIGIAVAITLVGIGGALGKVISGYLHRG
jgi:hypothetical protein